MAHIVTAVPLPGITGLLETRLDSSEPIRDLTQALLRGPSPLTEGERELIATLVSHRNACRFCTNAHAAVTARYYGDMTFVHEVLGNTQHTALTPRITALLDIAAALQADVQGVTPDLVERARAAGASDMDIHDTVLTAALFCFYNRYVDGLASDYPESDAYFETLADRLMTSGYERKGLTHGTHRLA